MHQKCRFLTKEKRRKSLICSVLLILNFGSSGATSTPKALFCLILKFRKIRNILIINNIANLFSRSDLSIFKKCGDNVVTNQKLKLPLW